MRGRRRTDRSDCDLVAAARHPDSRARGLTATAKKPWKSFPIQVRAWSCLGLVPAFYPGRFDTPELAQCLTRKNPSPIPTWKACRRRQSPAGTAFSPPARARGLCPGEGSHQRAVGDPAPVHRAITPSSPSSRRSPRVGQGERDRVVAGSCANPRSMCRMSRFREYSHPHGQLNAPP